MGLTIMGLFTRDTDHCLAFETTGMDLFISENGKITAETAGECMSTEKTGTSMLGIGKKIREMDMVKKQPLRTLMREISSTTRSRGSVP
jgi:hypothetical protein